MSDEMRDPWFRDNDRAGGNGYTDPEDMPGAWASARSETPPAETPYSFGTGSRAWQTAAELATPPPSSGFDYMAQDAPAPPPVGDGGFDPSPGFPQGMVDLTEEGGWNSGEEDSVRIPASVYRDDPNAMEPSPGTVEVDSATTQSTPVVMGDDPGVNDRRAARARALGEVAPGADVVAPPVRFHPPSIYKPWPSFVLIVFRLLIAAALAISAMQELLDLTATKALWATTILPYTDIWAYSLIMVKFVIALMLILGFGTRIAGILMMVAYVVVLVFTVWGAKPIFTSGQVGFLGELEVIMILIGLLFVGIGGGGAAIDGAIHRARIERKNAKAS